MLTYEAVLHILGKGAWVVIVPRPDYAVSLLAYPPEEAEVVSVNNCSQRDRFRIAIAMCERAHAISEEHS